MARSMQPSDRGWGKEADIEGNMSPARLDKLDLKTKTKLVKKKLVAIGVLPGNRIHLLQSYPSYNFRVGYSEFAVDANMAHEIFVRP